MPRVEIQKTLAVDKNRLFEIVFNYQDYPRFIYGLKAVQVERTATNKARVTYRLSLIKDIVFTVDLLEDERLGKVTWSLVESNFFDIIDGYWKVQDLGSERCRVEYRVELESKIPIPRLILHQLVKRTLPTILMSFEKQARRVSC